MYIQIDNTGFVNKGAELMLSAIVDRLEKEKQIEPKLVFGKGLATLRQVQNIRLFQIAKMYRCKIRWEWMFHQKYTLDHYGLVKEKNVDVILDASGFGFGDQWTGLTTKANKDLEGYYKKYKKRGTKIIFLPQAFGPFETKIARERIKIVLDYADLIYARDKISYKHICDVHGDSEKVRISPDFTILYSRDIPHKLFDDVHDAIGIIPNSKMLTHTNSETAEKYKRFLIDLCSWVSEKKEKLVILNHSSKDDWELIKDITSNVNFEYKLLDGLDTDDIKAAIGELKMLVSSRFHGVVSGLNQGVPTFCTSWSHKYLELLEDYSLPDNVVDVHDYESAFEKFGSVLNSDSKYIPQQAIIEINKKLTDQMWQDIVDFLKN
ncbi:MAG: polysaccharide pyruvyl transferase WcaK-like protein [Desulforhopalus sp.]|jgi:polysaccharide pyruvyl transferase WcaK-like protein